ncbi:MAG: SagB/ThcOx family dehydrogenase [Methanobrevibacter sp. CfCl-M3]
MTWKGKFSLIVLLVLIATTSMYMFYPKSHEQVWTGDIINTIKLPQPQIKGNVSVEEAIQKRRSIRSYSSTPLTLEDISQLMWVAQGITDSNRNYRTVPSGSHTFGLEIYILIGDNTVNNLEKGLYHYNPFNHTLEQLTKEDLRLKLSEASDSQQWVEKAQVDIIITGNYQKVMDKYYDEVTSARFINNEAGHAGQNIYLESTSRNLGTVAIGSFDDKKIHHILPIPSIEKTIYVYPVGHV